MKIYVLLNSLKKVNVFKSWLSDVSLISQWEALVSYVPREIFQSDAIFDEEPDFASLLKL